MIITCKLFVAARYFNTINSCFKSKQEANESAFHIVERVHESLSLDIFEAWRENSVELNMADKDNSIHENNIGSPEKGEKSKGSKSKRKGKNRGQHAGADSTAETNKSTSVAAVNQ